MNDYTLHELSKHNIRKKSFLKTPDKSSNDYSTQNAGSLCENWTLQRCETSEENRKPCETNFSENEVLVFGKSVENTFPKIPIFSADTNKEKETIIKEKENISKVNERGKEIQSFFEYPWKGKTNFLWNSKVPSPTTSFILDQTVDETSNCSMLPDVENKMFHGQNNNNVLIHDSDESKIPDFPSSSTANMMCSSTDRTQNQNTFLLSVPTSIQKKIVDFVASRKTNSFKIDENETEISGFTQPHKEDEVNENVLNELAIRDDTTWKQTFLPTHDGNSSDDDPKNSGNISENLTSKRYGTTDAKRKSFEKGFSDDQSSLQLNALQERIFPENTSTSKYDSICMETIDYMYSSSNEKKNERFHPYIQNKTELPKPPEWYCDENECLFNMSNQTFQPRVKSDSYNIPSFSNKDLSASLFLKSSNENSSSIFHDGITSNEELHMPEANSASSINVETHKAYSTEENINSINYEISDTFKKDFQIRKRRNTDSTIASTSNTQQKEDSQMIHDYEQIFFSYSSANGHNERRFLDGNSCSDVNSPHEETFRKVYRKKRRRISFSDTSEDEINDNSTGYQRKEELRRETLLLCGYFLSVRKTKHFRLSSKTKKNSPKVNKRQLHHNSSSNSQEINESCFRMDSENHSFVGKSEQRKNKALKMKIISLENEREEFEEEDSCIKNQYVESTREKLKAVQSKMKRRLFIETDTENDSEEESLTFTFNNYPAKISITDNGNLRLQNISPDNEEEVYWIRSSDSCSNESDLSSSLPAGSSDDENFRFHESTDMSSGDEFSSECHSITRDPVRTSSNITSNDISETYQTCSEPNFPTTSIIEKSEKSTAVWDTSFDGERESIREFVGNAEQNENSVDDYAISPENGIRNSVDLRNSNPRLYHLKHGNVNLRFYDDPTNHVTLRIISENEGEETGSYSKKKGNSKQYLTIKELKSTDFEEDSLHSALSSDDDASIHTVSTAGKRLESKKGECVEEATSSRIREGTTIDDIDGMKFDFKPEKGITEVKFRSRPDVTYLQYKSQNNKLYFKKKYF